MKIETGLKVLFVALQDPEKWGKEQDVRNICPEVQVKGLRLVATAKAVRGLVRLTYQGKKVSQGLGSCTHDELARFLPDWVNQVEQFHARLSQGLDPFAEDEKSKKEMTFERFVMEVYLPNARVRKKSHRDDESRLRKHILPYLGEKRFDELNMALVTDVLHSAKAKGLKDATVNRIRALLSVIFNLAIDHELIASNPMKRVKKLQENNQIERYLSDEELQHLMLVLKHPEHYAISNKTIVAIIKFLLLTGVRKREAMDMQWSDVDFTKSTWLLKFNKSGKARHIALNTDAMAILNALPKISTYIFANPETGKPYNDIRKTFDKVMQCAGISNMRIHDLRHNFASLAVNSGESLFVVQKLLGHASPQTTQRYAHLQHSTLQNASEKIAAVIREVQAAAVV
ncbi:site-specific integrase [Acinetobacter lwoffii]|uniref:tyrosine-type recombinase/integrase n=1 Tax=Acinetobacter lwoffii TaxID=28090 RepID=UPI00209B5475|nr:site-specific integrase [Acinetobacter lwoffii]MCO8072225.1 site-specific integrase [Acinetobacter lwoffii]MCO8075296.1 site-specific integrase [Acinetobacter lwoffii]